MTPIQMKSAMRNWAHLMADVLLQHMRTSEVISCPDIEQGPIYPKFLLHTVKVTLDISGRPTESQLDSHKYPR